MNCPSCSAALRTADRHGIEIDYCPQCRGVWLDRGELEKIIERSTAQEPAWDDATYPVDAPPHDEQVPAPREWKKKKSFWSEVFDFD